MSEAILVGGSRDGFVTEAVSGMKSVNNISLNEELDGPEYIDLYIPTNLTDKEGREIFAHVGRYDSEESKTYWDQMDEEEKTTLIESTKEIREAEAKAAEEEQAKKDAEEAAKAAEESAEQVKEETPDETPEEAPAKEEKPEEKPEEATEEVNEVTPEETPKEEPKADEEKAE